MLRNWSWTEIWFAAIRVADSQICAPLGTSIGSDALILEWYLRSESGTTWPSKTSKTDQKAYKINIKIILSLLILTFLISDSWNKILDFPESFWCSKSLLTKDFIFYQFSMWRPYCWYVGCFKRTIFLYFEINKNLFRSSSQIPRWFILFFTKPIFQTLNVGLWLTVYEPWLFWWIGFGRGDRN